MTDAMRALVVPKTASAIRRHAVAGSRAVEVGCGPGQYALAVDGQYYGFDITMEPYRESLPRHVDVVTDGQALALKPETVDIIFYVNTFDLLADGSAAVRDAYRSLRSGGRLLLFDYSFPVLTRLRRSIPRTVLRRSVDWRTLVAATGFRDVAVTINTSHMSIELAQRWMPRSLREAIIDRLPFEMLVAGRKP
jgi:ubiquinone/menaquinone biosynthesis C-methylase UbiE